LLVSLGFAALCWQIALLIEADSREELRQRAAQNLQLYVSHLNGELSRYEYLPRLLATYEGFAQLLGAPR
ncbi:MAG: sensor histidine kinase, partial [Anaerolineae bacterium]|nr:sensor histidine kinase [Anaerolineae bacterium]